MSKKAPYSILYEDDRIIAVYKSRDVFTVQTDDKKTWRHNLFYYLSLRAKERREQVFLVHRLDYETSGILLFAKTKEALVELKKIFETRQVKRLYEAVVLERLEPGLQEEIHLLLDVKENGKVIIGPKGKESITRFETANQIQIGTALKIEILTGRKNQIRLSLHKAGLTLIGDKRYSDSEGKRMYLNAYQISLPSESSFTKKDYFVTPLWLSMK